MCCVLWTFALRCLRSIFIFLPKTSSRLAVATPAFIATEIAKQKKRDEARGTSAPLPPAESLAARVVVPMVGSRTVHIIERAEAAAASKSGAAAVGDVGHMHPASSRAILARLARDHLKPTNFEATSVLAARAATSAAAAAGGGRAAAAAAAVTATVAAVLPTVLPTLRGTMNRRLRLFPRGLSAHLLPRPGPAPGLTSMASNKLASEGRDVQLKFALPSGACKFWSEQRFDRPLQTPDTLTYHL